MASLTVENGSTWFKGGFPASEHVTVTADAMKVQNRQDINNSILAILINHFLILSYGVLIYAISLSQRTIIPIDR